MANMFTRSITTYEACCYDVVEDANGNMTVAKTGCTEFISTNATLTEARAALKAAGVTVKRGQTIKFRAIETTLYGMPVETFMLYAQPIERAIDTEQVSQ